MPRFTFLIASARDNGNSEQLARIAAESLDEHAEQQWLALRNLPLDPFEDRRHGGEQYSPPTGNALALLEATMNCDHLVFVTPVYWYSVPAPLKLYLDHWSHWMRVEETNFKNEMIDKHLWVVAASAGPASEAQHMLGSLKLCADYLHMKWGGHVLGNGTAAGDVLSDDEAVRQARQLLPV